MPAEFENGFFVRKPAWHGLGTVLPDYVEREEAFRLSGQDWTVERWEVLARKDANSPRIEVPAGGRRSSFRLSRRCVPLLVTVA